MHVCFIYNYYIYIYIYLRCINGAILEIYAIFTNALYNVFAFLVYRMIIDDLFAIWTSIQLYNNTMPHKILPVQCREHGSLSLAFGPWISYYFSID